MATANWIFASSLVSNPCWELNAERVISSPTSLKFWEPFTTGPALFIHALLRASVSGNVREGQIEFEIIPEVLAFNSNFLFRVPSETPTVNTDYNDSYTVQITKTGITWKYNTSIIGTRGFGTTVPSGQFYRLRLTWWEAYSLTNQLATALKVEQLVASVYSMVGSIAYDTNRRNEAGGINCIGVGMKCSSGTGETWFEDCIIYKA